MSDEERQGVAIEEALQTAARAFRYPPTPALAEDVRAHLETGEPLEQLGDEPEAPPSRAVPTMGMRRRRLQRPLLLLLLVLLLLVLLALLLALVPDMGSMFNR